MHATTADLTADMHSAANTEDTPSASTQAARPQLIVSLTSYHKRFGSLLRTLKTLDNQTYTGDYCIQIHLSDEDLQKKVRYKAIFSEIERSSTRIRFYYHRENLRSYKKYFYALMRYPRAIIVTTDDDVLYPADWLKGLVHKHLEMPDCIVCYRGHYLERTDRGFKKYLGMMLSRKTCVEPSLWLLPTGASGVLYPPGTLDAAIALDSGGFTKLAPKADDFWLKLASLAKKTNCVRVNANNMRFPHVPFTQFAALTWRNAALGENDRVLKTISRRYPAVLDLLYEPSGIAPSSVKAELCYRNVAGARQTAKGPLAE